MQPTYRLLNYSVPLMVLFLLGSFILCILAVRRRERKLGIRAAELFVLAALMGGASFFLVLTFS